MERCPSFNGCSQNFCPLDLELNERKGKKQDRCKWMREPLTKKVGGREFVSGGAIMPSGLLSFVPQGNLKYLNESSRSAWEKLKAN